MLTGSAIFLKDTADKTAVAIEHQPAPEIRAARQEVPMALEQLMIFAMNKSVDGRCNRAEVMLDRMAAFQGLLEVGDRVKTGEHPSRLTNLIRLRLNGPARLAVSLENPAAGSQDDDESPQEEKSGKSRKLVIQWPQGKRHPVRTGLVLLLLLFAAGFGVARVPPVRAWVSGHLPTSLRDRIRRARDAAVEGVPPAWRDRLGIGSSGSSVPGAGGPTNLGKSASPPAVPIGGAQVDAGLGNAGSPTDATVAVFDGGGGSEPDTGQPRSRASAATLIVRTIPPALVFIDGKRIGRSPTHPVSLEAGDHVVEAGGEKPKSRVTQKITLGPGEKKAIVVRLRAR
jgi:hypothetical protein